MKKLYLLMLSTMMAASSFGQGSAVYFTKDITPESLVSIYEALGVSAEGKRVAVKISTGESSRSNHLRPELIKNLVQKLGANLVECNTAYGGGPASDCCKIIASSPAPIPSGARPPEPSSKGRGGIDSRAILN